MARQNKGTSTISEYPRKKDHYITFRYLSVYPDRSTDLESTDSQQMSLGPKFGSRQSIVLALWVVPTTYTVWSRPNASIETSLDPYLGTGSILHKFDDLLLLHNKAHVNHGAPTQLQLDRPSISDSDQPKYLATQAFKSCPGGQYIAMYQVGGAPAGRKNIPYGRILDTDLLAPYRFTNSVI